MLFVQPIVFSTGEPKELSDTVGHAERTWAQPSALVGAKVTCRPR